MLGLPPWCNRGIGSITAASQQRAEGAQVRQAGSTHFLRNIMHYCTFNIKYDHLRWCGRDLTLFLDYSSHGIIAVYWDLEGFWLKRSPGALVQGSIVFIFFFRMIRITGRSRTIQAASVEPEPNIPLSAVTQSYETLPFDPRSCARHIVSLHKASGSSGDISEALWHGGADNRGINRKDLLAGGCSCSYHCPLNLISKA